MKLNGTVRVDDAAIDALCPRHHIARLSLFGSVLTDDFRPDSDIDVLVEFQPGHTPGLEFFRIQDELSRLLGRRVDLNTPKFLSPVIRERVRAQEKTVFAARR